MNTPDSVNPDKSFEAVVADLWMKALEVDAVDAQDNFLDVGGTSISAFEIIAGIRDQLGIDVTVQEFFEHLTIAEMCGALHRKCASQTAQRRHSWERAVGSASEGEEGK